MTMINGQSVHEQPAVMRTERGLSVIGTRITLYAILDYLHADWPPKLIQEWLNLSEAQMAGVLTYLAEHREEVETEYQEVVRRAAEIREYWDTRNRERFPGLSLEQLTPEQRLLWEKLQEWKKRIAQFEHNGDDHNSH